MDNSDNKELREIATEYRQRQAAMDSNSSTGGSTMTKILTDEELDRRYEAGTLSDAEMEQYIKNRLNRIFNAPVPSSVAFDADAAAVDAALDSERSEYARLTMLSNELHKQATERDARQNALSERYYKLRAKQMNAPRV
jgi:DNA-binding NarL/FixJ family response regulator